MKKTFLTLGCLMASMSLFVSCEKHAFGEEELQTSPTYEVVDYDHYVIVNGKPMYDESRDHDAPFYRSSIFRELNSLIGWESVFIAIDEFEMLHYQDQSNAMQYDFSYRIEVAQGNEVQIQDHHIIASKADSMKLDTGAQLGELQLIIDADTTYYQVEVSERIRHID